MILSSECPQNSLYIWSNFRLLVEESFVWQGLQLISAGYRPGHVSKHGHVYISWTLSWEKTCLWCFKSLEISSGINGCKGIETNTNSLYFCYKQIDWCGEVGVVGLKTNLFFVSRAAPAEENTTLEWKLYPPRELKYRTWGKGKSSSNLPLGGDMEVPRR